MHYKELGHITKCAKGPSLRASIHLAIYVGKVGGKMLKCSMVELLKVQQWNSEIKFKLASLNAFYCVKACVGL